jgi:hypothetical protein
MVNKSPDCSRFFYAFSENVSCETACPYSIQMLRKNRKLNFRGYPVNVRNLGSYCNFDTRIFGYSFAGFCNLNCSLACALNISFVVQ